MAHRVFQQVAEHLVDLVRVGPHGGQRLAGTDEEPAGVLAGGGECLNVAFDGGGEVHGLAAHLQTPRVDPGDVQELGDQAGDAVGVGIDGLQHQPFLVIGEPFPLGQQRGGEALHGRQGRAQLVGNGRDEFGMAALGTAAGLGAAQADHQPAHRAGRALAYVAGGDEDLAATRQQEVAFGLADAGGEATVGVGQLPPAAALEVLQRQRVFQRAAEGGGPGNGGDPRGGGVEADDPAGLVRDDESVGKVVRIQWLVPGSDVADGDAVRILGGAHDGRMCRPRSAHADSHIPVPHLSNRCSGPPSSSPY